MSRRLAVAELVAREDVARDTWIVDYALEFDVPVVPGQFAMVHPGDDDRYVLGRPLSILDASDGRLRFLIKVAGRGTRDLVQAPVGSTARIFGPLGRGFESAALLGGEAILVAGGVGVVPLHLLARKRLERGSPPARALFGARTRADLPLPLLHGTVPWESWVEEDPAPGEGHGRVTEGLVAALRETPDAVVATCGPTAMMRAVARICRERRVPLWLCLEEQMGCGAGVCRACVLPRADGAGMLTVCHEGPVLPLDAIEDYAGAYPASDGEACP